VADHFGAILSQKNGAEMNPSPKICSSFAKCDNTVLWDDVLPVVSKFFEKTEKNENDRTKDGHFFYFSMSFLRKCTRGKKEKKASVVFKKPPTTESSVTQNPKECGDKKSQFRPCSLW
jgi:hypothetical protein